MRRGPPGKDRNPRTIWRMASPLIRRSSWKARKGLSTVQLLKRRHDFQARTKIESRQDLLSLGTAYGGWTIPATLVDAHSVCYLAGIGEDITFDLHLIARFGCSVHAFDPVPLSQEYAAAAAAHEPRFVLHRYGLWSRDETLPFHAPESTGHISHSATNLKGTDIAFDAEVRSVSSVLRELGHDRIDLLKLSVEGSEFEIIDHVVAEAIPIRTLCVEYAQPAPLERIEASVAGLAANGFVLVHADISLWNWKLTFVKG
jgi:FkbM family methyltransferase